MGERQALVLCEAYACNSQWAEFNMDKRPSIGLQLPNLDHSYGETFRGNFSCKLHENLFLYHSKKLDT